MKRYSLCPRILRAIAVAAAAGFSASATGQPPDVRQPPTRAVATGTPAHASQLIEFDAPGAATVTSAACVTSFCGTVAFANNDWGEVVGAYTDANVVPHGFARWPDGHFVSFDAPGAGLGSGLDEGTVAYSVNDFGAIAGQFQDASLAFHGFVRGAGGRFRTIDVPGAGTGAGQGTQALVINNLGLVGGIYADASGVQHGFIKERGGIATFDPPGSVYTAVCDETCLNDSGEIVGSFLDATTTYHGFVRGRFGVISTFDAPGAGSGSYAGTVVASVNARHEIAGYVTDSAGAVLGFVRSPAGRFTLFDVAAGTTPITVAYSINRFGVVAGAYLDAQKTFHGLSRGPRGAVATFDAPGAGTGAFQGTRPSTNNVFGDVAGWWIDPAALNHGFVWSFGHEASK